MTTWTNEELNNIGAADELKIASLRRDGTLRNPVIIWVVRLGDELYVRSVKGRTSAWFRGILVRHQGLIRAGGVEKDVTFEEEAAPEINNKLDTLYQIKYGRNPTSVEHINSPTARTATIKLVPRS